MLAARSVTTSFLRFTAALAALAVFATSADAQIPTPRLVSSRQPDGLIVSTGNIYFTTHDRCGGHVWRTGQTSSPGQEIQIYGDSFSQFGDIVYAKIGNDFFGYFFAAGGRFAHACDVKNGAPAAARGAAVNGSLFTTYSIRRIPLAGGPAVTLKVLSNLDIEKSHRNLVTDGYFLYWQDNVSIHKMPIGGGADIVLDRTSPTTPAAGLSLHGSGVSPLHSANVYYAVGNNIYYASVLGSITPPFDRVAMRGSSRVTALQDTDDGLYWGEQSGTVYVHLRTGQVVALSGAPSPAPTSLAAINAGAAYATQCDPQTCQLRFDGNSNVYFQPIDVNAIGVSVTPSDVIWGDAGGIHELSREDFGSQAAHRMMAKKP